MRLSFKIVTTLLIANVAIFANIDDKIESTQVKIDGTKSKEKMISSKLDKIAIDIKKHQANLKKLSDEIKDCKLAITQLKKKTLIKGSELKKIEKIYKKLAQKEKLISKKAVDILSKELSIDIITNGDMSQRDKSLDNIVYNEIIHRYVERLKSNFKKTKAKYIKINKSMDLVKNEIAKLSNKVDDLQSKKEMLVKLNKTQQNNILSLKSKKKEYLKRLNQIKREQNSLAKTLNKLHITKTKEQKRVIKATKNGVNVRQIGSSYQHGKLIKYRGAKTIAPLKSYTVTQNFGNYIDPIYKIKIFNDSVILRSKKPNAKVINILDGKVIYAQKTPMLDRVVIVKNRDNIHTIYAHLSKISPAIRVGKHLKKGYVIGRVDRELTFEVTQNEKHINPMRLIK